MHQRGASKQRLNSRENVPRSKILGVCHNRIPSRGGRAEQHEVDEVKLGAKI